jgi:hypothetical protein
MATKVVVSIFIEFQDYNGSTRRSCIYNYNEIVYKVNTNDEIKFTATQTVEDSSKPRPKRTYTGTPSVRKYKMF